MRRDPIHIPEASRVPLTVASHAWERGSGWSGREGSQALRWSLVPVAGWVRPDNVRVTTVITGGMRTNFFDRFRQQGIPMPDEATIQDYADGEPRSAKAA